MGEIKSTIDLVMEKTRGMELSAQERKELRNKEYLLKAKALSKRYLNGDISLVNLEKELATFEEKAKEQIIHDILKYLAEDLDFGKNYEMALNGIERLSRGRTDNSEFIGKIRNIFVEFDQLKEKHYQDINNRIIGELSKTGISGDAVNPNVESNPVWKETISRLAEDYRGNLEKLKAKLIG